MGIPSRTKSELRPRPRTPKPRHQTRSVVVPVRVPMRLVSEAQEYPATRRRLERAIGSAALAPWVRSPSPYDPKTASVVGRLTWLLRRTVSWFTGTRPAVE